MADIQATEVVKCDPISGLPLGEPYSSKGKACKDNGIEAKELNEALADFEKIVGGFRWKLKSDVDKNAAPTPPLVKVEGENVSGALTEKGQPTKYEEPSKKDETVTMSKAELEALLGNFERKIDAKYSGKGNGDTSELIRELTAQLNPGAPVSYARAEDSIDMADFLTEPVNFYTYLNHYEIFSETRYGQEVRTPYGRKFVFSNISGHVSGAKSHGKTTVQISMCQVQTKKELDWLKKSPKFNTIFFESIGELSEIDKYRAQKLAGAMMEISSLSEYAVMQRAIAEGIPAHKDVEIMKSKLIQKMAENAMQFERSVSTNAALPSDSDLSRIASRGVNQIAGASVRSY